MNRSSFLFLFMGVAALAGCKDKSSTEGLTCGPGPAQVSCHYDKGCIDYVCDKLKDGVCKTPDGQLSYDRKGCEETRKGRYVEGCACPRPGAIGGCRTAEEGRTVTTWIYGTGMTADEYRKICDGNTANEFITP